MGDEFDAARDRGEMLTLDQVTRHVAKEMLAKGDWSGMPVPVPGLDLVLEPRYKHKDISEFRWSECYDEDGNRMELKEEPPGQPSEYIRVNSWWNSRYQLHIVVLKDKQGRARFTVRFEERLAFVIRTLDAASAWPLEAEEKAQKRLATLIRRTCSSCTC